MFYHVCIYENVITNKIYCFACGMGMLQHVRRPIIMSGPVGIIKSLLFEREQKIYLSRWYSC